MKLRFLYLLTCMLVFSCKKDVQEVSGANESMTNTLQRPGTGFSARRVGGGDCAVEQLTDMASFEDGQVKGIVSVINDDEFLNITVSANESEVFVKNIEVLYGTEAFVTSENEYTVDGAFVNPQVKSEATEPTSAFNISIPLSAFQDDCFFLNIHANFYSVDANGDQIITAVKTNPSTEAGRNPGAPLPGIVQYCVQRCELPSCGQLRTQSQGGWGTSPHGNNPGTYLYAHFDEAFPAGVVIGCTPNYSITLSSKEAVTNFLPAGGKAAKLTKNYTNPSGFKNVLAAQLVALTLSVGFDDADDAFGEAGMKLGDMLIKSGTFAGFTVRDFLEQANYTLGGCGSNFTIQQVLDASAAINENYLDGNTDKGFLVCPQ